MKLLGKALIRTTGWQFAAGHDIYALTDELELAKGQVKGGTGIGIGLLGRTYGGLAARSGMASKIGIAVGSGAIDADYTEKLKVIF